MAEDESNPDDLANEAIDAMTALVAEYDWGFDDLIGLVRDAQKNARGAAS